MAAHEQRIRHQNLRSGRRVVNVVVADDRIAQRRRQLAANVLELLGILRRPVDQRPEIEFALVVDVPVDVIAERDCVLLHAGHGVARQLDVGHSRCQTRGQLRVQLRALRDRFEIVGQIEEQIDRKQFLRFEYPLLLLHQRHARVGVVELRAASQQAEHAVLRRSAAGVRPSSAGH